MGKINVDPEFVFIYYRYNTMRHHLAFRYWNNFLLFSTIWGKESETRTLGMITDKLQIQAATDEKNKSSFADRWNISTVCVSKFTK